jgi:hypothetical protein
MIVPGKYRFVITPLEDKHSFKINTSNIMGCFKKAWALLALTATTLLVEAQQKNFVPYFQKYD